MDANNPGIKKANGLLDWILLLFGSSIVYKLIGITKLSKTGGVLGVYPFPRVKGSVPYDFLPSPGRNVPHKPVAPTVTDLAPRQIPP